jgi:DNA-binding beta-propeller fold protein YncE
MALVRHPILGNFYFAAESDDSIGMVTPAGVVSRYYAGGGAQPGGITGAPVAAAAAQFAAPRGAVFDKVGTLYVADTGQHALRVVSADGSTVSTLAGNGTAGTVDNDIGTLAQFSSPTAVAIDTWLHRILVADGNRRVRLVSPLTGAVSNFAGVPVTECYACYKPSTWQCPCHQDGVGAAARFSSITSIVISQQDSTAYLTQCSTHQSCWCDRCAVRKITPGV